MNVHDSEKNELKLSDKTSQQEIQRRPYKEKSVTKRLLQETISRSPSSWDEICSDLGLKPATIRNYAIRFGIKLPAHLAAPTQLDRHKPELDSLIDEGLSLEQIGDKVGLTREAVRQYIWRSGQFNYYRQGRKQYRLSNKKAGESEFRDILGLLNQRMFQLSRNADWPTQKAVEHLCSVRYSRYSFDSLHNIFTRYENAKLSGKRLSLEELAEGTNIHFVEVDRILRRVNVEPMYGHRQRSTTPQSKKLALKRACQLDVSSADVAYFLEIPSYVADYNLRRLGRRSVSRPVAINSSQTHTIVGHCTLRLASQVYEAQDLGFNVLETSELLNIADVVVNYAIEHRQGIEQKIIQVLKVLYPEENIEKPYRWK